MKRPYASPLIQSADRPSARGIGFRPGEVVVIESDHALSQADAEVLATYARALYQETGVHFVILQHGFKVSEAHRSEVEQEVDG